MVEIKFGNFLHMVRKTDLISFQDNGDISDEIYANLNGSGEIKR